MAIENKITTFLNKRTWIIPLLFGLMCLCLVSSLLGVELKGVRNMDHFLTFNTGAELAAIFAGVMVTFSILPSYKRQSGYTRVFVSLIAVLCFLMACDIGEALVDKIPELTWLNKTFATLVWANETAVWFFFFVYCTHVLKSQGKVISISYLIGVITLVIFVLIPVVTVGNPLYFKVIDGVYYRKAAGDHYLWYISRFPSVIFSVLTIIAIFLSKEKIRTKIIISIFMGLPLVAMGSGGYKTGVAVQYVAMMMSVVLMFAFLFSDNEKDLFSTNKELGLATNIQKHMLPSIFPAFPDRKEFDIFASMSPAKEVGGDFYDFFLIDDYHLGLVMADVSDKGIPAALFMMACKIMVQNYAMMGKSPSEVLTSVNNQICQNNQDEMFVTIWLGILDLKTGILTAANAGHEKPAIQNDEGKFELFKDTHGFVVGWYKGVKYVDYQVQLKKGSKIFLYTDGVPEATSANGQFTRERMVKTLNKYRDMQPQEIIQNMKDDIDLFVGQADQFDDITMLCAEFKGYDNE
ncbi:MAG: PP2C family protein-serine/threonine phosphatase [Bacilli bacterium]|nr:PP2C family protein-serine/threonine phosphatase [Bacilli bacterium]